MHQNRTAKTRRLGASVLLASTMLLTAAGTAFAASSGTIPAITAEGVSFTSGTYRFDPWPCNSSCYQGRISGFNYWGTLTDTAADGHDVFLHSKVNGYSYGPRTYTKGGNGARVSIALRAIRGSIANQAKLEACVDRGTLLPDRCVEKGWFYR